MLNCSTRFEMHHDRHVRLIVDGEDIHIGQADKQLARVGPDSTRAPQTRLAPERTIL